MNTVVITGANRGIGLQLAKQYAAAGNQVIAACRSTSDELAATGADVCAQVDVATAEGSARLREHVGERPVDILVNNAGILRSDRYPNIDLDAMEEQFRVNTLGPLRVTLALADRLHDGSKVAIVSSRVGSIADNSSGNNYGYRASKAAVNMVGMNLRHDLAERGIAVALLHPGLVATDMTGGSGISPSDSASGLISRIDALNLASSGTFWHAEGYELPW